ncbi:PREDICTED: schlafen-like protein 1 [Gavialis gangeticus]|uniref:schlafen-like protein 1 n=1 Tax=Gavialis gangeticus TaxID=94835 RepID=UPI00092EDB22|nr:PREDICTED: schlafen-like protein 1 [Gavialis gangeticus]
MDGLSEPPAEKPLAKECLEEPVEQGLVGRTHSYVLYIGNLNPKYSQEVLRSMLKDILGTATITLQRHDIEVVKKPRQAYAFVQVTTEMDLECILKQLLVTSEMEQELVKELVMKGKTLVVGDGRKGSPSAKECRENDSEVNSASPLQCAESDRRRIQRAEEDQASHSQEISLHTRKQAERPSAFLSGTRSDSAIVRREIVGQERLFYGAFMGSESRNVEFKRGSGEYLSGTLKYHVRKYACAFLNSEGGSLFVGVEDSGFVHGVRCGHKEEDRVRLLIDSILKGFKPQVFPDAYALTFIPVIKAEDTGIFLKVVRLSIHPPRPQGEVLLYETDQGEVYLRRDGSIQGPLSGSAIQEWCRQKWTAEVRKLEERIRTLVKENEKLQHQVNQEQSANPNSRFCTMV